MKNNLLTICITGLVLSVTSLPSSATAEEPIFTDQLTSYAAISGGALNIAGNSVVDRDLAAKAAVVIGAGINSQAQNIYAGAAVTIGTLSTVKDVIAGAAATIGGGATTGDIHAGAAITLGAFSNAQKVYAGAAITSGAGATKTEVVPKSQTLLGDIDGQIKNTPALTDALKQIQLAQTMLIELTPNAKSTPVSTVLGGEVRLTPGIFDGTALTIDANSTITFDSSEAGNNTIATNHVWVINLSQALTVGANTTFEIEAAEGLNQDTHTIIWNVGAALNLGANTSFLGTALVDGAVNAATSSVSCGHLYATGIISIGSIGTDSQLCGNPSDLKPLSIATLENLPEAKLYP